MTFIPEMQYAVFKTWLPIEYVFANGRLCIKSEEKVKIILN